MAFNCFLKRVSLILCLIIFFSINNVSAYESYEDIPSNISLKCGESYSEIFNFPEEVIYSLGTSDGLVNYQMALTKTSSNYVQISLFPKPNYFCQQGQSHFQFTINDVIYNISLNVTADDWDLGTFTLSEGESINVGSLVNFKIQTTDNGKIRFILAGCGNNKDDFLADGQDIQINCEGESIKFFLENSFASPFKFSKIKVYSSEPGFQVIKNGVINEVNDSECVLGLNTLGVQIKRGNLLAITTINSNTGKYEPNVIVRVLDQAGELEPINGVSDNTGYFGQRLSELYKQDLVVKLEKDGCEPYTKVLSFDKSYNDYLEDKETEENKNSLKIIFEENSINKIKGQVTNKENETIGDAKVKITSPSSVSSEILSDSNGFFEYNVEELGEYKIQVGKESYKSSELYNMTIKSEDYIVIFVVDGIEKRELKKGDIVNFKIYDDEDNVLPLNFEAKIDGKTIKFLDGVSEDYTFNGETKLEIPSVGGYEEKNIWINEEKKDLTIVYIFIAVGILVILILFLTKNKNKKVFSPMEVQLNPQD